MPARKFMRFPELNRDAVVDAFDGIDGHVKYSSGLQQSRPRGHTHVVGRFTCPKPKCAKSWASGRVFVEIYFTSDNRFDADVWKQQCRACRFVAAPVLDEQVYRERIASKLQLFMRAR